MTTDEYPKFKEHFWTWFDALSINDKERFWYYKVDLAETNFFFTTYRKNG